MFRVVMLITGMIVTTPALCDWYQVQGTAPIQDNNIAQARNAAVNNAINNAQKQKQRDPKNKDGSLGVVKQSRILNEMVVGHTININMQVELIAGNPLNSKGNPMHTCRSQAYKAAILIPKSIIYDKLPLRYGNIMNFDRDFARELGARINEKSDFAFSNIYEDQRIDFTKDIENTRGVRLPTWLTELTDSQYILVSDIQDLSMTQSESSGFTNLFKGSATQRNLNYN